MLGGHGAGRRLSGDTAADEVSLNIVVYVTGDYDDILLENGNYCLNYTLYRIYKHYYSP